MKINMVISISEEFRSNQDKKLSTETAQSMLESWWNEWIHRKVSFGFGILYWLHVKDFQ